MVQIQPRLFRIAMISRSSELKFKELYDKHYAPFCLYAHRFIQEPEVCEDMVSEVFTQMWGSLNRLDLDSPACIAYIKMSVKNTCLNYLKRHRHRQTYEDYLKRLDEATDHPADSLYSLEELYRLLNEALEKLPESHRQVFLKSYVEDKSREEIAAELNVSIKSVDRYKKKTLELLRSELKDFLPLILFLLGA